MAVSAFTSSAFACSKLSFTNFTLSLACSTFCLALSTSACVVCTDCTVLAVSAVVACGASTVSACATVFTPATPAIRVAPKAAVFIVFFIKYLPRFCLIYFQKGYGAWGNLPHSLFTHVGE